MSLPSRLGKGGASAAGDANGRSAADLKATDAPPAFFLSRRSFVLEEVTKQHDRSHLDDRLCVWLQQAEREQRRLAGLVGAADMIAWINRRWGRSAGDSVLRKLARRLAASLAPDDAFARYEGNRFGI